jgi:hypothetical protein
MKTFEDAVRLAVERGFNLKSLLPEINITKLALHGTQIDIVNYDSIIYQLLFGTPFIDRLVSRKTCLNCGLKFIKESKVMDKRFISCRINENLREDYTPCDRYKLSHDADYHRSQMANIMDIDKLKEYVINLLEV